MVRTCHFLKRRSGSGAPADRPPVAVSHILPDEDVSIHDLEGGLRVSTERTYHLDIPCIQTFEGPRRFVAMTNPVNQCGPLLSEQVPVVTGSDFDSFMASVNKRCNTVHVDDLEDAEYNAAYDLLGTLNSNLFEDWEDNDLDRERWMNKFDCHKRQRMADAFLSVSDCSEAYVGTKDLSVKQEVLLKRNDPSWAPRVIYAGNDAFNTITGPAMMVAMERFEQLLAHAPIGRVKYCTAYKKNDVELSAFITEDPALLEIVEGDYSANDKEQRKRVHLLFDRFLAVIKMPYWLRRLLKKINKFKVQSRAFGFQATLENQLPTGTTSTTVRNSVFNALMFSVAVHQQRRRGRALILGDDLLGRLDGPFDIGKWKDCVSRFRMVLKAKKPPLHGGATFLSKRFIIDREVPCMVPLIGKAIARFNARALYREDKSSSQYMAGKSLSYAYEFRHVPFMRDFFLLRYTLEDSSKLDLEDLAWGTKISGITLENIIPAIKAEEVVVSDDEFRDWMLQVYDIGLCDLEELCESVLLSDQLEMVDSHIVPNLSIDW